MAILIDTCILRELHLPRPYWKVRRAVDDMWWEDVRLSVVSFAILNGGMMLLPQEFKQRRVREWMRNLSRKLGGGLLGVDYETAMAWGQILISAERRRLKLPYHDSLIAATAKRHGLTVMTRNIGYFAPFNIEVLNPWGNEKDTAYDFGAEPDKFDIEPGSTSADLSLPRGFAPEDEDGAISGDQASGKDMSEMGDGGGADMAAMMMGENEDKAA